MILRHKITLRHTPVFQPHVDTPHTLFFFSHTLKPARHLSKAAKQALEADFTQPSPQDNDHVPQRRKCEKPRTNTPSPDHRPACFFVPNYIHFSPSVKSVDFVISLTSSSRLSSIVKCFPIVDFNSWIWIAWNRYEPQTQTIFQGIWGYWSSSHYTSATSV